MTSDGNLRRIFREQLPTAHWQSIETGAVGPGTPDSNFCFPWGREGWIEFKQTTGWAVTLRPQQIAWLTHRARMGGRVFVAVRQRRKDADALWLALGKDAVALRDKGLKGAPMLGVWAGGPSRWDWSDIHLTLAGFSLSRVTSRRNLATGSGIASR